MRPLRGYMMQRPQFVALLEHAPKEWVSANRSAIEYTKHRMQELWLQFGYVSAGVGTLIRMEAEALADSDFIRHQAMAWMGEAATADVPAYSIDKALNALRTAHNISQIARGHANAARTLCREEAAQHGEQMSTRQDLEADLG